MAGLSVPCTPEHTAGPARHVHLGRCPGRANELAEGPWREARCQTQTRDPVGGAVWPKPRPTAEGTVTRGRAGKQGRLTSRATQERHRGRRAVGRVGAGPHSAEPRHVRGARRTHGASPWGGRSHQAGAVPSALPRTSPAGPRPRPPLPAQAPSSRVPLPRPSWRGLKSRSVEVRCLLPGPPGISAGAQPGAALCGRGRTAPPTTPRNLVPQSPGQPSLGLPERRAWLAVAGGRPRLDAGTRSLSPAPVAAALPGHNQPFHAEPSSCGVSDSALSSGGAECGGGSGGVPLSGLSLRIASFRGREKGY